MITFTHVALELSYSTLTDRVVPKCRGSARSLRGGGGEHAGRARFPGIWPWEGKITGGGGGGRNSLDPMPQGFRPSGDLVPLCKISGDFALRRSLWISQALRDFGQPNFRDRALPHFKVFITSLLCYQLTLSLNVFDLKNLRGKLSYALKKINDFVSSLFSLFL